MSTMLMTKTEEETELSTRILSELFEDRALRQVHFRLWDGTYWPNEAPRPVTLVLKHPGALRAMFLPGTEVGLGEAYIYDDFDIEGDIEKLFIISDTIQANTSRLTAKLKLGRELLQLPERKNGGYHSTKRGPARLNGKPHSIARDRQAVTYHYRMFQTISMRCGSASAWFIHAPISCGPMMNWIQHRSKSWNTFAANCA